MKHKRKLCKYVKQKNKNKYKLSQLYYINLIYFNIMIEHNHCRQYEYEKKSMHFVIFEFKGRKKHNENILSVFFSDKNYEKL